MEQLSSVWKIQFTYDGEILPTRVDGENDLINQLYSLAQHNTTLLPITSGELDISTKIFHALLTTE